jgi:hypothetical protein
MKLPYFSPCLVTLATTVACNGTVRARSTEQSVTDTDDIHASGSLQVDGRAQLALLNSSPMNIVGFMPLQTLFNDWSPPNFASGTPVLVQASDNSGTTITGLDATGVRVGDIHTICNFGGHEDASTVALSNLDPRSQPQNRFIVPGGGDRSTVPNVSMVYKIGIDECTDVVYAQPDYADPSFTAWIVKDGHVRFAQAFIQKLQLYPMISPAPITGSVNDYNPINAGIEAYTCDSGSGTTSPCSVDGSDGTLQGTTVVNLSTVDASGATITGLKYVDGPHGDLGPVIVLFNMGPGNIVLSDTDPTSAPLDQFAFSPAGIASITLAPGRVSVMLYHRRDTGGWLELNHSDGVFDSTVRANHGAQFYGQDPTQPIGTSWMTDLYADNITLARSVPGVSNFITAATRDTGSYDTTASQVSVYGLFAGLTDTRSAGTNALINTSGYFSAVGGTKNYAIYTDTGDVVLNAGGGTTTIAGPVSLGGGATASPGVPSVDSGVLGPGSTDFVGNIKSIGANSKVTLTYSQPFAQRSWCVAQPNIAPELIVVTNSATAPTFACFDMQGVAASCTDFTYNCWGK